MTQQKWLELHEWLLRIFPAEEAEELFAEHVQEAREAGLEIPE